jgi:glycosyltransferase involved in cell wall biosynthesis
MWAVTGHCAYAGDCERWRTGCGACPDLDAYPPIARDTTASLWRVKQRAYARSRLTVVAPSSWTERIARESPLLANVAVYRIPNGLDLSIFRPIEREAAREVLGLDPALKSILFVAHGASDNPRKGTHHLEAALNRLPATLQLIVVGHQGERWRGRVPQRVAALGMLRDDRILAAAYAASDVVVVPSTVENMPNSAIEAMACGRPVVGFDAGGMRDAVRPGETGLLVPVGDEAGLAAAIETILGEDHRRTRYGAAARRVAEAEFDAALQARRFAALYESLQ